MLASLTLAGWSQVHAANSGRVDSSNIGVATEDAVISSGLPNLNLDAREFSDGVDQQRMNTLGPEYPTPAAGALAQEYMIFKFDFSSLPQGAFATSEASFDFSAWSTHGEGGDDEKIYGRFRFFEITDGDSAWTDRYVADGVENPTPVTWNSLAGTFVELSVYEDDTGPPNNATGNPFGVLYPDLLVSNGGLDGANRVVSIPIPTVNRLITGESVGLAMGSIPPPAALPSGDFDRDAHVDGKDLLLWQRELGNSVTPGTGADGNGDGIVDGADLELWYAGFGSAATPTEGVTNFSILTTESFFGPASAPTLNFDWSDSMDSSPLPEPGCIPLLVSIAMSLACRTVTTRSFR